MSNVNFAEIVGTDIQDDFIVETCVLCNEDFDWCECDFSDDIGNLTTAEIDGYSDEDDYTDVFGSLGNEFGDFQEFDY